MDKRILKLPYLPIFVLLLSACISRAAIPEAVTSPLPPSASLIVETQLPKSTDEPPKVYLVADPGTHLQIQIHLLRELMPLTATQGWILEKHTSYAIDPLLRVVVALPPAAEIEQWADQSPDVQFVAVGISGLATKPNLSLIGPDGFRQDQLSFLAGYLAAVITPDWRVATLVDETNEAGAAGFRNGVIYYCGLCRLTYPPYYDYPLSFSLQPDHSEEDWRQAAEFFEARAVDTLFINVKAQESEMPRILSESGLIMFGNSLPADAEQWIATLRLAPEISLRKKWNGLLQGEGGWQTEIPLIIEDVNRELLSTGRLQWIEKMIDELQSGFVDPSVTPISPE